MALLKHNHLKLLTIAAVFAALAPACAPDRAEFTRKKEKKAQGQLHNPSETDKLAAEQLKLTTPEGLVVHTDEKKKRALAELAKQLHANNAVIKAGDSRQFTRIDPVLRKQGTRKQTITEVNGDTAFFEIHELPSSQFVSKGQIKLDELDSVRSGILALADEKFDEFYELVAMAMLAQGGLQALPPTNSEVEIDLRLAGFDLTGEVFRLLTMTRVYEKTETNQPRKLLRVFSMEARLNPKLPRPFDITYLAYGKEAATKVLINFSGFSAK